MSLILFYNSMTKKGAIGKMTGENLQTTHVFPDASFGSWTHVVEIKSFGLTVGKERKKIFFYNQDTRGGAIGILEETTLTTVRVFEENSFDTWTHITAVGNHLFFYDQNSGAAATASIEVEKVELKVLDGTLKQGSPILKPQYIEALATQVKSAQSSEAVKTNQTNHSTEDQAFTTVATYAQGRFGTWTHLVACGQHLFFYNKNSGAGSLAKLEDGALTAVKEYEKGTFGTWSHVVGQGATLFFYNDLDRSASIWKVSDSGISKVSSMAKESFGYWSHIVAVDSLFTLAKQGLGVVGGNKTLYENGCSLFFYNIKAKNGAIGHIQNNTFETRKTIAPGQFGQWTTIAGSTADSDLGARLSIFREGTKIKVLSGDGKFTEADVTDEKLTNEQQEDVLNKALATLFDLIDLNWDEVKKGHVKAEDIGGALYGALTGSIVGLFDPFIGKTFIGKLARMLLVDTAKNAGRFYGAAVDELIALLSGKSEATVAQIVGTLATIQFIAVYAPGAPALVADGWALTIEIGNRLGGTAESAINEIGKVAAAAVGVVGKVAEGTYKTAKKITDWLF